MEEGSFRCDANVSVRPKGSKGIRDPGGSEKYELLQARGKALEYEIKRQIAALEGGGKKSSKRLGFDANEGITVSMEGRKRPTTTATFPDPDLVPLKIDEAWVAEIQKGLPELPEQKKERFVRQYEIA